MLGNALDLCHFDGCKRKQVIIVDSLDFKFLCYTLEDEANQTRRITRVDRSASGHSSRPAAIDLRWKAAMHSVNSSNVPIQKTHKNLP